MSDYALIRSKATPIANAYMGLALLLLPTAIGCNVAANHAAELLASPLLFFGVEIIALLVLMFAVVSHRESMIGFFFALGFALFMGTLMGPSVDMVAHANSNGSMLVSLAAFGTVGAFVGLSTFAHLSSRDFSGLSGILYAGLWGIIVAGVANLFFHSTWAAAAISGVGVAVFCGYILHDVSDALHGHEHNWIILSLNLYMNVVNLFLNLLRLLPIFGGSDD